MTATKPHAYLNVDQALQKHLSILSKKITTIPNKIADNNSKPYQLKKDKIDEKLRAECLKFNSTLSNEMYAFRTLQVK